MSNKGPTSQKGDGTVHGEGIFAIEVHREINGKLTKIKGFKIAGEFIATNMSKKEAERRMERCHPMYPEEILHASLRR